MILLGDGRDNAAIENVAFGADGRKVVKNETSRYS
jgi:hypothetical protein